MSNNRNKKTNTVSSKVTRKKTAQSQPLNSNRIVICISAAFLLLGFLVLRIGYFQFIDGNRLKELASRQQTASRVISANRGNIYDSTGKLLAQSAAVDTITINPSKIAAKDDKSDNDKNKTKEKVAKTLSEIFELNYEEVLEKVNSEDSVETIIKKVEQDKVDELKEWIEDNKVYSGINIDADVKRYYPYGNLASTLIGFCDTDNKGQEGLELKWDSVLSGTPGKITTIENAASGLIPDKNESYVAAENGSNITLTIDATIQSIVEKYLKQACIENDCKNGGTAIVMAPSTGDILAMATYPDYDSNNPRNAPEALKDTWDTLSSEEQLNSLYPLWRNRCVTDTYEPGSTFKIITAAVGLEENVVSTDTTSDFSCIGHEVINGLTINCWKWQSAHGTQTLRQALMNSCNPAMMQLGKRISSTTLYKYYKAFGLFDKTGIDTSGEVNSYFWAEEDLGPIELATMSFGQRFRVTPIQLITAISSVANDGVLVQPHIVKQIENPDTGSIITINSTNVRQVISKETANQVMDMLESVVTDGTGKYGQVKGYSVAGKTGTSEPDFTNENPMYVASFVGISPVENPEVVVLVTLYDPQGKDGHQGGTIAAPVVSEILSEVLPYLGVPSDDLTQSSSEDLETITVPDVRNKTVAEAKKALESSGFTAIISGNDTSLIVTDQVPKPGTSLIKGATVNIYSSGNEARVSVEVPNLKGMTFAQARNALKARKLNISVTGSGVVLSQDPMVGSTVEEGTVIHVTLKKEIQDAH